MKNVKQPYIPANLIDGNYDNFAHTEAVTDGIWIRLFLGGTMTITSVKVTHIHSYLSSKGVVTGSKNHETEKRDLL